MSRIKHPYANANSRWVGGDEVATSSALHASSSSPRLWHVTSAPELRTANFQNFKIAPQRLGDPPPQKIELPLTSGSGRRFIKQTDKVLFTLQDQDRAAFLPIYGQDDKVRGGVTILNTNAVVSVTVKLRGAIETRDYAGLGKAVNLLFDDVVAHWDMSNYTPCPSPLPFKGRLSRHYIEQLSGKRVALPPSYGAQLPGLPGFKIEVKYAVVVEIREKTGVLKRSSVVECPFLYRTHTRSRGKGSLTPHFNQNVADPVTLFPGLMSRSATLSGAIRTQLYLPTSQTLPVNSIIPFHVKLTATSDTLLDPFAYFPPPSGPESFLPECSTPSLATPAVKAIRSSVLLPTCLQRPNSRSTTNSAGSSERGRGVLPLGSGDISLELMRTTTLDTTHYDSNNTNGKRKLVKTVLIGETIFLSPQRGPGCISWSGELRVSKHVTCGGFKASNVQVADTLIFRVTPPGATSSTRFRQVIPVQLTTEVMPKTDHTTSSTSSTFSDFSESKIKILELY